MLLTLALGIAALWLTVHLTISKRLEEGLDKLSSYPIYVYAEDEQGLEKARLTLKDIGSLKSLTVEEGMEAAAKTVEAYQLNIDGEQLQKYYFPDVLSVNFQPVEASIQDRVTALNRLGKVFPAKDIEAHREQVSEILKEQQQIGIYRHYIDGIMLIFTILIMLFGRLSFELNLLLIQKYNSASVVDRIRYYGRLRNQTIMLAVLPPLFGFAFYQLIHILGKTAVSIGWHHFALQVLGFIIADLGALFIVRAKAAPIVKNIEIKVVVPSGDDDA